MNKKLRIEYSKMGVIAFISHRDLIRLFERVLRTINLPFKFTEGFNPHPKMTFGLPLPIGVEGKNELMDIELSHEVNPDEITKLLRKKLPKGISIKKTFWVDKDENRINTRTKATYIICLNRCVNADAVHAWLKSNPKFHKTTKSGKQKENSLTDSVAKVKVYMKKLIAVKMDIQGGISFSNILYSLLQHINAEPQQIKRIRRIW
ncbi:MAG: DUF2344 domain-containing protein [Synergistetes bacterium]|nr:DUF2344 domain-containing protein [Synergistota bacterium]